jgi:hypothetical protein
MPTAAPVEAMVLLLPARDDALLLAGILYSPPCFVEHAIGINLTQNVTVDLELDTPLFPDE